MQYTLFERIVYQLKRYWLAALIAIGALVAMWYTSTPDGGNLAVLFALKIGKQAIGLMSPIIIISWIWPKFSVQQEILEEHNTALAIVIGGAIIGANL